MLGPALMPDSQPCSPPPGALCRVALPLSLQDKSGCSYTCLWNAYKIMTRHLPLSERNKLFHDNAVRFYRCETAA